MTSSLKTIECPPPQIEGPDIKTEFARKCPDVGASVSNYWQIGNLILSDGQNVKVNNFTMLKYLKLCQWIEKTRYQCITCIYYVFSDKTNVFSSSMKVRFFYWCYYCPLASTANKLNMFFLPTCGLQLVCCLKIPKVPVFNCSELRL